MTKHILRVRQPKSHRALVAVVAIILITACKSLTDLGSIPTGTVDPATYRTPAGATAMFRQATWQFEQGYLRALEFGSVFTDELQVQTDAQSPGGSLAVDLRTLPDASGDAYGALQDARAYATQAIGALAKYAPIEPAALRGVAYAQKAYAEVYLADIYCSGVPLSELEFEGDFTYKGSSTTAQVYAHAITLFDSALALAGTNDTVMNFARVGKARALLDLDSAAAAAQVAAAVPDRFAYQLLVEWCGSIPIGYCVEGDAMQGNAPRSRLFEGTRVSDREGTNGLPYQSDQDPRTAVVPAKYQDANGGVSIASSPAKYGALADAPAGLLISTSRITVASGIEARLIEAEAALRRNDVGQWLTILNALRTTCTDASTCPTPAPAGTGGLDSLPPLRDPGADHADAAAKAARVDLMFAERAKWLFVTGTRQGDLRRLLRQYPGRTPVNTYPTGIYVSSNPAFHAVYGSAITSSIPETERRNPLFTGCLNHGA